MATRQLNCQRDAKIGTSACNRKPVCPKEPCVQAYVRTTRCKPIVLALLNVQSLQVQTSYCEHFLEQSATQVVTCDKRCERVHTHMPAPKHNVLDCKTQHFPVHIRVASLGTCPVSSCVSRCKPGHLPSEQPALSPLPSAGAQVSVASLGLLPSERLKMYTDPTVCSCTLGRAQDGSCSLVTV